MASTDTRPVPRKNAAYRHYFTLVDADGLFVAGATGLDSEVSKDGGAFADCTNEAQEVGQGLYYIELVQAEMNADAVAVIVKSNEAVDEMIILFPEETGDIRVNATQLGDGVITSNKFAAGGDHRGGDSD